MQYLIRLHLKRVSSTGIGFVLVIATFLYWDDHRPQSKLPNYPTITYQETEEMASEDEVRKT